MKFFFLITTFFFISQGARGAEAPRCLSQNGLPGIIKNYGEFIIKVPANGPGLTDITGALNEGDGEGSQLDWTYGSGGDGNTYFKVNFRTWNYSYPYDTDVSFKKFYAAATAKAYLALDKVASLPNVSIKCDLYSEAAQPAEKDLLSSLTFRKAGTLRHHLSEGASEKLILALITKNLAKPTEKAVFLDIRNVICKTPLPLKAQQNTSTCFVNPYVGDFVQFTEQDPDLYSLLIDGRAHLEDVKGIRTLNVKDILCTAVVLQAEPLKLGSASCKFPD